MTAPRGVIFGGKVYHSQRLLADWTKPSDLQSAYKTGDRVTHDGYIWLSLVSANVWEPGSVGTEDLWAKL